MQKGSEKEILPAHKKPADAEEFYASLSETERELHRMGEEKLGSSYFLDRTRQYKEWLKKKGGSK